MFHVKQFIFIKKSLASYPKEYRCEAILCQFDIKSLKKYLNL